MNPKWKSSTDSSSDEQPSNATYKLSSIVRSRRSEESKLEKIRMIMQSGADINFQDANSHNNTFLHIAIRRNELKVVAVLVECNANIYLKNDRNKSALELVEDLERPDVAEVLNKRSRLVWRDNAWKISNNHVTCRALIQHEDKESWKPKFKKGSADMGASGQIYEIRLTMLFHLRGEIETTRYYLGGNVANAGAFDDVVFQYWDNNGKPRLILLQAKHRDNTDHRKITLNTFKTDKDFELHKYFSSYKNIKAKFNNADDAIFRNQFENIHCEFVIYTNARLDSDLVELMCHDSLGNKTLRIGNGGKAIQFRWSDISQYLKEKETVEHIAFVAKAFVTFILSENNDKKMGDPLVSVYHVFWAKQVINVKLHDHPIHPKKSELGNPFYCAEFRDEFLNGIFGNHYLLQLRSNIFNEYAKQKLIIKKGNNKQLQISDNINSDVMEFVKFLTKCKSKLIIMEEDIADECTLDIICNMTSVILTYDSKCKNLKFAEQPHLGPKATKVMEAFENASQGFGIEIGEIKKFRFNMLYSVVKRKLKMETFKVPKAFGNLKPTFVMPLEIMCKQFIDSLKNGENTPGNTCVIKGMNRKLLKDVCKLVGSVLVLNESSGHFQLNKNSLSGQEGHIVEMLTNCLEDSGYSKSIEFDFVMDSFPRLTLHCSNDVEIEMKHFISNLTIFTDQPNVIELRGIILNEMKEFYQLTNDELNSNYLKINNKITKDWEQCGKVKYLTKRNSFFKDISRQPMHFRLRYPVGTFTGRVIELESLHQLLCGERSNENEAFSHLTTICGLGGIGKSELARKYASIYGHHYDNNIIWIESYNFATMADAFRKLCRYLINISTEDGNGRQKRIKDVVRDVYNFFSKRKSLFIFDNAQRYGKDESGKEDAIEKFLPCSPGAMDALIPSFLITSRCKSWPNHKVLNLRTLAQAEAIEFVASFLKIKNDLQNDNISKLTKQLQCLPLALQQAVAYIKEKDEDSKILKYYKAFTISDYLSLYETQSQQFLNFNFPEDSLDLYTGTTLNTFDITLQTIRVRKYGEKACDILNIIAYLAPNDIPSDMFMGVLHCAEDVRLTVELLTRYSLVDVENGFLNIHRVVQHVIRLKLQQNNRSILQNALMILQPNITIKEFIDHCMSAWSYANKYNELVHEFPFFPSRIVEALGTAIRLEEAHSFGVRELSLLNFVLGLDHRAAITAQHRLSVILFLQGNAEEACSSLQDIAERATRVLGSDHAEVLSIQNNIALVLASLGNWDAALSLLNTVLEKRIKIFGQYDPNTLKTKMDIAEIWAHQGQYDLALNSQTDVFEKFTMICGPDNCETIAALTRTANVMVQQGKYDRALIYYRDAFDRNLKLRDPDQIMALSVQESMAKVLALQGKDDEAIQIFENVSENLTTVLGPDHPQTLSIQNNISHTLLKQGKYEKAVASFRGELVKMKTKLRPEHRLTLATYHDIANAMLAAGKYDEALLMHAKVLRKMVKIHGSEHPNILSMEHSMCDILIQQKKYDAAIILHKEVHKKMKIIMGLVHPITLTRQENFAKTISYLGKYDEALEYYYEFLQELNITLGADHPETLAVQNNIAEILSNQGKFSECSGLFRDISNKLVKLLGPDHTRTTAVQYNYALSLYDLCNYDEALFCFEELLERTIQIYGTNHPNSLNIYHNIAKIMGDQGKYDESLIIYDNVLKSQMQSFHPEHPDVINTLFNRAMVFYKQGKYELAIDCYIDVMEKQAKILGPEHESTIRTMHKIAVSLFQQGQYDESLSVFKLVLDKDKKIFGPDHTNTLSTEKDVAVLLWHQCKYDEAAIIYKMVLEKEVQILGPDHQNIAAIQRNIDQLLLLQNVQNYEENTPP